MPHVYFDHNATTPLDERVLAAMLPYLREQYGNASSRHEFGTLARKAVNQAREQVAALVGVQPVQVVFTSGGTEAQQRVRQRRGRDAEAEPACGQRDRASVRGETGAGTRAGRLESAQARGRCAMVASILPMSRRR